MRERECVQAHRQVRGSGRDAGTKAKRMRKRVKRMLSLCFFLSGFSHSYFPLPLALCSITLFLCIRLLFPLAFAYTFPLHSLYSVLSRSHCVGLLFSLSFAECLVLHSCTLLSTPSL